MLIVGTVSLFMTGLTLVEGVHEMYCYTLSLTLIPILALTLSAIDKTLTLIRETTSIDYIYSRGEIGNYYSNTLKFAMPTNTRIDNLR